MMSDKFFIGYYGEYIVGPKGRIFLPAKACPEKGEEVVIRASVCRQEKCLKIMPYKNIADKIDGLVRKRDASTSADEYQRYENLITDFCLELDYLLKVDLQHRISIPEEILFKADMNYGDVLEVVGGGNSLIYTKKR